MVLILPLVGVHHSGAACSAGDTQLVVFPRWCDAGSRSLHPGLGDVGTETRPLTARAGVPVHGTGRGLSLYIYVYMSLCLYVRQQKRYASLKFKTKHNLQYQQKLWIYFRNNQIIEFFFQYEKSIECFQKSLSINSLQVSLYKVQEF